MHCPQLYATAECRRDMRDTRSADNVLCLAGEIGDRVM
jgi:hypothetical protein